jgi:hypothetical protein
MQVNVTQSPSVQISPHPVADLDQTRPDLSSPYQVGCTFGPCLGPPSDKDIELAYGVEESPPSIYPVRTRDTCSIGYMFLFFVYRVRRLRTRYG